MGVNVHTNISADAMISRDAMDLHRGLGLQALGYLLKLGHPLLLVFVVRAYGASAFGLYTFAQAVMLLAARVAVLGFDKGLLWWVPRQAEHDMRLGVRPVLRVTTLLALGVSVILLLSAQPAVLRSFGADPGAVVPLRLMTLGIVTQVWMDVLVHAALGRRQLAGLVFVKETAVPMSFVIAALAFHAAGAAHIGLALAFVVSNVLGALGAAYAFSRAFATVPWPTSEAAWPPRALTRYCLPMGIAELSNSLLQRIDTYAVALLTSDLALVGVYSVVTTVGNAIRQLRRSFDPLVLAIVSEISTHESAARLAASYSRATMLVNLTQLPVVAAIWLFADLILPLFGPGFELGTIPLVILCGFWIFNGFVSLAGVVVAAYGDSRRTMLNVLTGIAVLSLACLLLIPRYGLVGAAWSVGLGYSAQGAMQLLQMRTVTGHWNYLPIVLLPWKLAAGAASAAGAIWLLTRGLAFHDAVSARVLAALAFASVYAVGTFRLLRSARS